MGYFSVAQKLFLIATLFSHPILVNSGYKGFCPREGNGK